MSETAIYSTRGIRAAFRSRAAALRVEVSGPGGRCRAALHLAEREARRFDPSATARRLVDYLVIAEQGRAPAGAGEVVLAPPVAARLLAGLSPLWVGRRAAERAAPFLDGEGRIGRPVVSVLDDGRWRGGVLEAPVDGEGLPTGATILVEDGAYRQPLRHWSEADATAAGCSVRASWRELPRPGPSHLALRPDPAVAPADLLAGVGRGHYLLDVTDAGRFSLTEDRFALPVCGFAFEGGRPVAPVAGAWLVGPAGSLLRHVEAVARDLAFFPLAGMIGAPTVLLSGMEVLPAPPRGAA
jgi:predicted Zn-dependent protease